MTRAEKQLRSKKYAKPSVKHIRGARVTAIVVSLAVINRHHQSARDQVCLFPLVMSFDIHLLLGGRINGNFNEIDIDWDDYKA